MTMTTSPFRRTLCAAILCAGAVFPAAARAQTPLPSQPASAGAMQPGRNVLAAGFGYSTIDGQRYILFNASPEFNVGLFGVGLDVNLRYDADSGRLRKEDWNSAEDVLRAMRYVRFGSKEAGTPVYVRGGELDRSSLGFGQVMYLYNNSPSYDARKRGAEVGLDLGWAGVEAMYSSFARPEIVGARGFVRPLRATAIPILKGLQVGVTGAADMADGASLDFAGNDLGTPTVYGADIGLPVLENPLARVTLYADMAKIKNGGSGGAVGSQLTLSGLGLARLSARMEHRFLGEHYMPSFFNSFYELERFQGTGATGRPVSYYASVLQMDAGGSGMYGELAGDVVNVLRLTGSYQRLYSQPNSGWFHADVGTGDKIPMLVVRGTFDKWGVGRETGLFKLDDQTLARMETGYKPNRFMTLSLVTEWTFAPERDANDAIVGYRTQKRVEPKLTFGFTF